MGESFISPEKVRALEQRMSELGIEEKDIEERFVRAQGRGGQKVNKTSSCVHIRHVPTGIEVKCQQTRARAANRFFARRILTEKLESMLLGDGAPRAREAERIRKQKKRRSRRGRSVGQAPGSESP